MFSKAFLLGALLSTTCSVSALQLPRREGQYARQHTPGIPLAPVIRQDSFDVLEHLTGISPYFDAPGVGLSSDIPDGCNVTAAAYLIRHGDIYAESFDYETFIQPFVQKLSNMSDRSIFANYTPLSFLTTWSSPISDSQVESLTSIGAGDAETLGGSIKNRYPTLASSNMSVWTATAERVLNTTQQFLKGFGGASIVQVPESANASANTLAPHESCPNFDSTQGFSLLSTFLQVYSAGPIQRFTAAIESLNFTQNDIFAMQELCGYESVISNSSDFCNSDLFTEEEWLSFEYASDIFYAYSLGYGQGLSPNLGLPWLRASTDLLNSGENLPQNLFLSFTHREEPAFLMTALGLYNDTTYTGGNITTFFPTSSINFDRQWKSSNIIPFLGHVALEKLSCSTFPSGDFVRVIVNNAPLPLTDPSAGVSDTTLSSGPGSSAPLDAFVQFVDERTNLYGDFIGTCGAQSSNATDTLSIYNQTLGLNSGSSSDSATSSTTAKTTHTTTTGNDNSATRIGRAGPMLTVVAGLVMLAPFLF